MMKQFRHWRDQSGPVMNLQDDEFARPDHHDAGGQQGDADNEHYRRGYVKAAEDEQAIPSTHCKVRQAVSLCGEE